MENLNTLQERIESFLALCAQVSQQFPQEDISPREN